MAAINKIETIPGFILQSKNFMVKFIAGLQKKRVSKTVEEESDWRDFMFIILKNLEKFPYSLKKNHNFINKDLNSWIRAHNLEMKISVKIEERDNFSKSNGSKKSLTISFSDDLKTQIIFHIKKKSTMKTLNYYYYYLKQIRQQNDNVQPQTSFMKNFCQIHQFKTPICTN